MESGTVHQQGASYGGPTAGRAQTTSGKAVASLVLGILAVVLFVIWASMILGPLAIVLGVMARNDAKRDPAVGGSGIATAGLVLGIVGISLTLVFAVIGFAAL